MARPRSNSKAPKQRAGAGSGKRKLGDAPRAGGAGGRPAKQSRREGRSKRIDRDVYEAEDSDPDEVKHSERFDKVDNYEYELPSDFEDEEIDEDLAFTEEDKKKFGSWFEKEVSADEDDEGADIGDGDGEDWDEDDEDGGEGADDDEDDDEQNGYGGRQGEPDDDDLLLGDDEDDADGDIDGLEEDDDEGGDSDEDDERHRAMLKDILGAADDGGGGARKRVRRDPNAAVVSEAYPESEFNLNPGAASAGGAAAGTLSIADLLQGLTGEERRKLGAARRLLEKVAGAGGAAAPNAEGGKAGAGKSAIRPVSVPLPSVVAERQERKAGYEAAAEDVTKWQSIVKANREAPTLRLVSGRNEVPRVSTTAALVAQHVPSADNALEAEVAALLEAAGADSAKAIEEAEEQLALKALSLEEAKERRERLAKMRSLLFYHELKARRLKSIKSKEYHRHLARAAKRKATKLAALGTEGGGEADVDAERAAAIEAEYQRAKERLTQRHRNSSRWARRALKRGQLQVDAGTKAALAEQLQLGQQLKRKIEGKKGDGSGDSDDSDASTSASDGEGGEGNGGAAGRPNRVRSAALELLAGGGPLDLDGENAPKKGLLALPFMKRAMERRKLQAQQEAEQLLRELDEQEHLRQQEDEDGGGGDDGDGKDEAAGGGAGLLAALVGYGAPGTAAAETAIAVGGRRKFGGGGAAAAAAAAKGADDDDVSDLDSDDAEDAEAKAERLGRRTKEEAAAVAAAAKQAAGRGKKARKGAAAAAPPTVADEADLDAVIAAGAAGSGLLVASSDVGVNLTVVRQDDDADAERRMSGRGASTRTGGKAGGKAGEKGGNVLEEVAAQQASLAAGGGRAALFQGAAGGGKNASAAADGAAGTGAGAPPKFIAAKTFGGARPGYAFKKGAQGLGYYLDAKAAASAGQAGAGGRPGAGRDGKGKQQQQQTAPKDDGVKVAGAPTQEQQQKQQSKKGKQPQAEAAGNGAAAAAAAAAAAGHDDDDEDAPMMRPDDTRTDQRDIIRQAFAGDDVEAEFAAEKAAAVAEELPNVEEPSALPGWGAWAGQQRNPRWMQAAKDKVAKIRADAAAGRKDANLKYVVISEKWDKKAAKYTAPTAPFPFTSQEAYERSLRQPLGREFNPDAAFRDLTRPAVLKQSGVAIAPLRYSEPVAKQLGKRGRKAEAEREGRRVMTVAGGMVRPGGGAGAKKKQQ